MPTVAEKWMEEGREQGLEQGRKEVQKRFVASILKLVQFKYPDLPLEIRERISSVQDPSTLESLMDLAIESDSLNQFQQRIDTLLSR